MGNLSDEDITLTQILIIQEKGYSRKITSTYDMNIKKALNSVIGRIILCVS